MSRDLLSTASLKVKYAQAKRDAEAKQTTVRIGDGNGLLLAVRATGAAWVLRYTRAGGKTNDLTLGKWPTCDLKQARVFAEEARKKLLVGVDPVQERKVERAQAARPTDSVRELLVDFLDRRVPNPKYRSDIEIAFKKNALPIVGAKPPQEITRADILALLRTIEARGAHGVVLKMRNWLRLMFEFGLNDESRPQLTVNPVPTGQLKSFAKETTPRKERHFPAITDPAEVPELMRCLRGITNDWVIRNAFMLSAHVWQRPTEIREAVWEEFDLDAAKWVIPAARMKLADEHWVPLSRQVVALLRQHQGIVGTTGWLFPGRRAGQPISEGTLTSRLNTMGFYGRHTPHGFRAMARTIGEDHLEIPKEWLEKQLAHNIDTSGLKGAYGRFSPAKFWNGRVTMMQRWSDWLDEQV